MMPRMDRQPMMVAAVRLTRSMLVRFMPEMKNSIGVGRKAIKDPMASPTPAASKDERNTMPMIPHISRWCCLLRALPPCFLRSAMDRPSTISISSSMGRSGASSGAKSSKMRR